MFFTEKSLLRMVVPCELETTYQRTSLYGSATKKSIKTTPPTPTICILFKYSILFEELDRERDIMLNYSRALRDN